MMSDQEIAQFLTQRCVQLRMLMEGHFLKQGLELKIWVLEDKDFGDNHWLFQPGYGFQCRKGTFYLSSRGHTSRFKSNNPLDIARWIENDVGLQTRMSYKDDIIAYQTGTPTELIDQVIDICNSAALPS